MTSLVRNQFDAFSEDNSLNKHGDTPTKNLGRKLRKKLRRSLERYNKNPSLENQQDIEKYQSLIRVEERNNSKISRPKKKTIEKKAESFDDILKEFKNKFKEKDEQSLIEMENNVKKLVQDKVLRLQRRAKYNAKKKMDAFHDSWIKHIKSNDSIMDQIIKNDLPYYVNMYIHDPNQYDGLKKFISEQSIEISKEIMSLIEIIKIEHTTFLDKYTKSQKKHFKRKRKSPKSKESSK